MGRRFFVIVVNVVFFEYDSKTLYDSLNDSFLRPIPWA